METEMTRGALLMQCARTCLGNHLRRSPHAPSHEWRPGVPAPSTRLRPHHAPCPQKRRRNNISGDINFDDFLDMQQGNMLKEKSWEYCADNDELLAELKRKCNGTSTDKWVQVLAVHRFLRTDTL